MNRHDPIDGLARRAAAAVDEAARSRAAGAPDAQELRAVHGRRRARQRIVAGVATVTAVALLAGVGRGLLPDALELWIDDVIGGPEQPPEPDDAAPIEPSELPLGLVVPRPSGIHVIPFDGEPILLEGDRLYRQVMWAFPDQQGGLVFQHEVTPPPWPPGAVMWLRAGATQPEVLVPPEAPWVAAAFPQAGIQPIGMATDSDGRGLFVYAVEDRDPWEYDFQTVPTRIMVADLGRGGALRQLAEVEGSVGIFDLGRYQALTAGGVVALVDLDRGDDATDHAFEGCHTVTLLDVEDGSRIPATTDCISAPGWMVLSHDGRSVGWIQIADLGSAERAARIIDLSTGATLEEVTFSAEVIPVEGAVPRLLSSPAQWLVRVDTEDEIRLVDLDGNEKFRLDKTAPHYLGWHEAVPYHHPFDLAPGASLGAGSQERPCQPFAGALAPQDLPEAVAETRQLLFDLAATCDYEGLAAVANEHATTVFVSRLGLGLAVGDDDVYLESEDALVTSWIADGRSPPAGYGIQSREPLETLAALLTTTPAHVDDAADLPEGHPRTEGSMWVWPAIYLERTAHPQDNAIWVEHGDYRIGITPDGTWRFFMAGDFD